MQDEHKASFCDSAPARTVMRVKVSVGDKVGSAALEVEERYGPAAPTTQLNDRFASMTEGETLLVSVGKDGNVLGTAWPIFRGNVSLEHGIPDMPEAEAASLLMSPTCRDGIRALRDHGVHPAAVSPSAGGCGHCHAASAPLDAGGAGLVLGAALATAALLRRR